MLKLFPKPSQTLSLTQHPQPRPSRRAGALQVACLSAAPLAEGAAAATLVAVGAWDRSLHVLALPSLAAAAPKEALGGDVIPRRHATTWQLSRLLACWPASRADWQFPAR